LYFTYIVLFVGKETEMKEKEVKLMELQEMYETRLLAMKVNLSLSSI